MLFIYLSIYLHIYLLIYLMSICLLQPPKPGAKGKKSPKLSKAEKEKLKKEEAEKKAREEGELNMSFLFFKANLKSMQYYTRNQCKMQMTMPHEGSSFDLFQRRLGSKLNRNKGNEKKERGRKEKKGRDLDSRLVVNLFTTCFKIVVSSSLTVHCNY